MAIRVGIIGYGLSARAFHLPFLRHSDAFEIAAISTSRADEVRRDWPGVNVYSDADALIADETIDLVINTAPNNAHFSLSERALAAGKHVVVEKPFVTRPEEGEVLVRLADERQRVLSVYHNRRWDGDFLTVNQLLAQGSLGAVRYFETHFDRFRPAVRDTWRESDGEGSGILFDLGPHLVDQTVQLFGMPKAVTAQVERMRTGARSDDMFRITLHYDDMFAVLVSSPFCAGPNLRYKIEGEKGSYIKYGLDPQEARLREGDVPGGDRWGEEGPEHYGTLFTATGAHIVPTLAGDYGQYFDRLAASITEGAPVPVTPQDALQTMRLIERARESAALGRTLPVD